MKKIVTVFMVCLLFCFIFTGCGKITQKENFRIVTSFYPMYVDVLNITHGIQGVEVINMTKPQTGCLHDYQLTTEDMKQLEAADAFVINGGGMEAFLDKVIKQRKNLVVIDASRDIPLISENGETNPHVWVSISDSIQQVRNITAQLAQADPAHAEQYEANAAQYVAKLTALKEEMHQNIDDLPHRDIVTFHEAFPYFAQEFNLHILSVIEREPGTEPSPAELADTIDKVRSLSAKALFTEPQYPSGAARTIAQETGAAIYVLDPVVTGSADETAIDAYLQAMRHNMEVLQQALR